MITSKCTLTIDLDVIRDNYQALQKICTTAEVGSAVKAYCFGLGVKNIAPMLANSGCKHFFVANKDEGVFLREVLDQRALNSEILKIGGQKVFLRNTLEEHKDFFWQLPQYHRPIRAHVSFKKEMQTQYRNFVPLFEQYRNVRLCLENDSHTTKITWPILSSKEKDADEGFKRNDEKGIVYAGEGCWGAPLRDADDCKSWTRDAGKVNQFNWIFISKEKIELRTVKYENVEKITSLTEATRFTIPEFIDLFGPKNGKLVEIFPQKEK